MSRDDSWLQESLIKIQENHFPDITDGNDIEVCFGRKSKTRLGSIAIREKKYRHRRLTKLKLKFLKEESIVSVITINGHFKDPEIPDEVVHGVLAHEFSHFVHGFNSTRKKQYRNPHAGGIITKELQSRGLDDILKAQKRWIKKNWREYIIRNA